MLNESVQVLANSDYVVPAWVPSSTVRYVKLTLSGYLAGISHLIPEIDEIHGKVVGALVTIRPPAWMP